MPGEVEILGVINRGFSGGVLEHGTPEVVNHDSGRNPAERDKGVLMAGKEMLHGLGHGEFNIHLAAETEHHDEET